MRWWGRILAAAAVLVAGMGNAEQAPKRIALVIGNAAYTTPGWELKNPVNDATLIAARLKPLGFEVLPVMNATKAQMDQAFATFASRLRAAGPDAVGFFYYAGHGVEFDGANLLVPVDVTASSLDELGYQAPRVNFLLRDMARIGNAANIIVLDACRNTPLPSGTRDGPAGGLAPFGDVPDNVFISYATRPGLTAPDNPGETNSVFTRALADALSSAPTERIETLFSDVQSRVFRGNGQRPEYRNGLLRAPDFRFVQPAVATVDRSELPPPPAPKTRPGETFKECDVCPEMVVLPAGRFLMGSPATEPGRNGDEGPQRDVTIPRPFAVGRFEVTFAQWDACVAAGGCAPPEEGPYSPSDKTWGRGTRPVINVSWQDAKRYVRFLNGRVGGKAYRLLSEAEWEYAARAGTTTAFSTGPTIAPTQAQYLHNRAYAGSPVLAASPDRTAPVGSFPGNAFKLHDMHGNVWEWVEDCYEDSYAGAPADGSAFVYQPCSSRVYRGGSWISIPQLLRSAFRDDYTPSNRNDYLGFRLARTVLPPAS